MQYFVIVFDPKRSRLESLTAYGEPGDALRERFRAERLQPDAEVVVLAAQSEGALHRTHGRYFTSAEQLLRGADFVAAE